MNGEDGNSLETKVALLMDRETDNHGDVMHKLRNLENGMNFLKDEVIDLQKRIRYVGYGLLTAYLILQGDVMEIIKGFM